MEENSPRPITCLFVLDSARKPVGIIHLHDILKTGI
jgi:Mg/Co/Ni transporter MgtE